MTDKERVLPRLSSVEIEEIINPPISTCRDRIQLGRLGMKDLEEVVLAQRDGDWERVKPLVKAAQAFLGKLDEIAKATEGLFVVPHMHGIPYNGPTWVKEKEALDKALAALENPHD